MTKRITDIKELMLLDDRGFIKNVWENGQEVLDAIDKQAIEKMTMSQFLTHCTKCGDRDYVPLLLSGIKDLYPEVYEAIPNDIGPYAWSCICRVLWLLGLYAEEESK